MNYRPLGPFGVPVSTLSFGCGHLPEDDEASTATIQAAIAAGCNYFETATFYCNNRCQQKTALGIKGQADKIMVSIKQGVEEETTADSYRRGIEEQLTVLGIDRASWMQVGWLALDRIPLLTKKGGALEAIEQARDEGLIDHVGFTGHDTPENFIEILKLGIFESMTVSYHLLNRAYESAIAVAHDLGVGVIVMNPLGGGMLAAQSAQLQQLVPGGAVAATAEVALRFVLANPGVSTACSGMYSPAMVAENARAVTTDASDDDFQQMQEMLSQFSTLGKQFCTGCRYCDPCPQGVDIAGCFNIYNLYTVYGLQEAARSSYNAIPPEKRASRCTECGECEIKCPNGIPIIKQLAEVVRCFEG